VYNSERLDSSVRYAVLTAFVDIVEKACEAVGTVDGLQWLVNILSTMKDNADVQAEASAVIANLASRDSMALLLFALINLILSGLRHLIAESRIVERILSILELHKHQIHAMQTTVAALIALTLNHGMFIMTMKIALTSK